MDRNKLQVLRDIGYRIAPTCSLCRYATFPQNEWGTCGVNKYEHAKHTGKPRDLSIHKSGVCSKFHVDLVHVEKMGDYSEFF